MRIASTIGAVCLLTFLLVPSVAANAKKTCELSSELQHEISNNYPSSRVANTNDLTSDDKELFNKDHSGDCPGLVQVDFYGDGKPTVAIVLLDASNKKAKLVIAHKITRWTIHELESTDIAPAPVVWSEKPGKYEDVYGKKALKARHPVVVFCGYESWSIVYAWTGGKVEKVWTSD